MGFGADALYHHAAHAAGRDFVREYVDAFRAAGLRVGLYYSLADWRIPAYWDGPAKDPQGWEQFREYVHKQVAELLTNYGKIDVIWFDGAWPHTALDWRSRELVQMIRRLQPDILINNRLGVLPANATPGAEHADGGAGAGESHELGDFGTPEHQITAEANRMWESCQVTTWRLWGYTRGERWRPADVLLDMLVEVRGKGRQPVDERRPRRRRASFRPNSSNAPTRSASGSRRMAKQSTAATPAKCASSSPMAARRAKATTCTWWCASGDGRPDLHLAGLETRVQRAVLLTTGQELAFEQNEDHLTLHGLPAERPSALFPVIRLECAGRAHRAGLGR